MVDELKKCIASCKDCIMEKWEKPITHPKIITCWPFIRRQFIFLQIQMGFILPNKQAESITAHVEIILNIRSDTLKRFNLIM